MTPLRQRMTEDMQVRNLALNTQLSYVRQVSLFARHFHKSAEYLGPEEIRAYQVNLPKAPVSSNATYVEGKTLTWSVPLSYLMNKKKVELEFSY